MTICKSALLLAFFLVYAGGLQNSRANSIGALLECEAGSRLVQFSINCIYETGHKYSDDDRRWAFHGWEYRLDEYDPDLGKYYNKKFLRPIKMKNQDDYTLGFKGPNCDKASINLEDEFYSGWKVPGWEWNSDYFSFDFSGKTGALYQYLLTPSKKTSVNNGVKPTTFYCVKK